MNLQRLCHESNGSLYAEAMHCSIIIINNNNKIIITKKNVNINTCTCMTCTSMYNQSN